MATEFNLIQALHEDAKCPRCGKTYPCFEAVGLISKQRGFIVDICDKCFQDYNDEMLKKWLNLGEDDYIVW